MTFTEILDAIETDIRNEMPHYQLLGRLAGYRKTWEEALDVDVEAKLAFARSVMAQATVHPEQALPDGTTTNENTTLTTTSDVPVRHTRTRKATP